MKLVGILILATSLAGCATVPMATPAEDAALKKFTVAPDRGGVYIYRDEVAAIATPFHVSLDGVPLGQAVPQSYLYPGGRARAARPHVEGRKRGHAGIPGRCRGVGVHQA